MPCGAMEASPGRCATVLVKSTAKKAAISTIQENMERKRMSLYFVSLLKDCAKKKDLCQGSRIHADVRDSGLLENNTYLGNTLVNMYAKCGALVKAQQVVDELPIRDVVSWNTLIAGYAQLGQGQKALGCFQRMQSEGLSPTVITYTCMLKACGTTQDVAMGKKIHDEIASQGLLKKDVVLGNALVDMYAKCGVLVKAQEVLDELPVRNVVSWSALIAGFVQQGQGSEALGCFQRMRSEGISPDAITYACILKACGITQHTDMGKKIHDDIATQGLLKKDVVLGTALVGMYVQLGQGQEALGCFEQMQSEGIFPNAFTYAYVLNACSIMQDADMGNKIHDDIVSQGLLKKDVLLGNALVDMYAKCGVLQKAQKVLDEIPVRNVISWNTLIGGYVQHGQGEEALGCFRRMRSEGVPPDEITYACILKACAIMQDTHMGKKIHNDIVCQGLLEKNFVLGTALVDMYVQQGQGQEAVGCFQQMLSEGISPDAITYACILKGCGSTQDTDKGEKIHDDIVSQGMLKQDVVLGNALVDMYAKCGVLQKAQKVLDELPVRNVVSWNTLISGYAQQGHGQKALGCFQRMQSEGLSPTAITYACILKACGSTQDIVMGKKIHDEIASQGLLKNNVVLGNALLDMYVKCGVLVQAQDVLDELPVRNVVSWSALIAGYVQQGQGEEALGCFQRMRNEGISPNAITYACILKACGITQDADMGKKIHDDIVSQGLLKKSIVLVNALVDMYVQQGQGQEALDCFQRMQSESISPNAFAYACVLKACGITQDADMGKRIHDDIVSQGLLEKDIVLGNALVDMYAKCGVLQKAQKVLDELPVRNVVSWSALIAGYVEQGQGQEALGCFQQMRSEHIPPNEITYACILKACGITQDADVGRIIHNDILSQGLLKNDVVLGTALVDMYVQQGQGREALGCFQRMRSEGISPDAVTYACILKACGITHNSDMGKKIHGDIASQGMLKKEGVLGNALVDMYAKCGLLQKAQSVLDELPVRNVVSWNALIAGYAEQGQDQEALGCFQRMRSDGVSPDEITYAFILKAMLAS
ncbi:hypothetical protein GOP47_0024279 [Adiantum capillus-veneris]|uniref:Pentatricopeptide repeat-containing protein n=1 Tax=Adiantum capillus-veneris TaxID=13818 RepID=A0A9D4U532_ADICA|nr:hypothetical protein GOP47_0024279 [Adiantum capillus-veneris]